jgi:hypothetical protein
MGMIIGITGRKRSGKDTVAAYLRDEYSFVRYQMASPLKKAVCALFGWDADIVEDGPEKEAIDPTYGISPRQVMQFMGFELGKELGDRFPEFESTTSRQLYVKRMQQFIEAHPTFHIVIPDIRMPYEVDAIRALGGYMIRVARDLTPNSDMHATESFVDTMFVDAEIQNTGSIEELYESVDIIMKSQLSEKH